MLDDVAEVLRSHGLRPIPGAKSVSVVVGSERFTIRKHGSTFTGQLLRKDSKNGVILASESVRDLLARVCFASEKFGRRLHDPKFEAPPDWAICADHPGLYCVGGMVPNVWVGHFGLVFVPEWAPGNAEKQAAQAESDVLYHTRRATEARKSAEDLKTWAQKGVSCKSL